MTRRSPGKRGRSKLSPIHGRIAALREALGLTQLELANKIERHHTAVSHWENGAHPDVDVLLKLASALGTTVDDLTAGDEKYTALREALAS